MNRVLMTADAVGGVWTYALQLSALLTARGTQVLLAVMGPEPSSSQRAEAAAVEGLELHARPYALEWMPAQWDEVDRAGEWLRQLADHFEPDVIHLNGFVHATLPWPAPVIVVAHSCVWSWWQAVHGTTPPPEWSGYHGRVSAGLEAADAIVAPSVAMRDALGRAYGAGHNAVVISNCHSIDTPPAAQKEPFVFAAGRVWDPAKNLALLDIAAVDVVWPIYVAGEASAPNLANAAALPRVTLLGRLPPQATGQWMARASIYAFPARYEPFGLSVLEAARAGCALVLGDIDSLRENWSGVATFVDPDDADELAAAVNELIRYSGRMVMGRAAAERAQQFAPSLHVDRYLGLYRRLVTGNDWPADTTRPL